VPIIDDARSPLTRHEVQCRFGVPSRNRRDAVHCDEFFYDECILRSCYLSKKDHVAFVELGRHSLAPVEQGSGT